VDSVLPRHPSGSLELREEVRRSRAVDHRLVTEDDGGSLLLTSASDRVEVRQTGLERQVHGVGASGPEERQEAPVICGERDHELPRSEGTLVQGDPEDLVGQRVVLELRIRLHPVDDDQAVCGPPRAVPGLASCHSGTVGRWSGHTFRVVHRHGREP
jgi:hypothetical protein